MTEDLTFMPPNLEQSRTDAQATKIGELLVNEGFIHPSDIDAALNIQKKEVELANLPLGKFLVKKGLITRAQLHSLLTHPKIRNGIGNYAIASNLIDAATLDTFIDKKKPDAALDEALLRRGIITHDHARDYLKRQLDTIQLGELAVSLNMLNERELAAALSAKKNTRAIGEILRDLNLITSFDLNTILAKYQKHIKLGKILMQQGVIDKKTLAAALKEQETNTEPIGKILMRRGKITETQLYDAFSLQYNLPFKPYDRLTLSPDQKTALTNIIGQDFAQRFDVLPVALDGNHITVTISDPNSIKVIRALRTKQLDLRVTCVLVTEKTFERLFRLLYQNPQPAFKTSPPPLKKGPTPTVGTAGRRSPRTNNVSLPLIEQRKQHQANNVKVHTEIISNPTAQSKTVARLHAAYECMAIAKGLRAQASDVNLFAEFIQAHFELICRKYQCRQVSFNIMGGEARVFMTATPGPYENATL